MKCPICDKEINNYSNNYMEHTLMEEHATCKDENHFYRYKIGNYEECIGGVIFQSHYADLEEERKLYKFVLELNRENYQKKVNT
ncbi:hypothetical protein ACFFIX_19735 [Metabacillus herbersteinensis]|uniref:C2H2-type domain-containing protein n=1 Tax=Metabacillus herbersteinensis TaxID=283816 RepID=A0ABV6GL24_9BACI